MAREVLGRASLVGCNVFGGRLVAGICFCIRWLRWRRWPMLPVLLSKVVPAGAGKGANVTCLGPGVGATLRGALGMGATVGMMRLGSVAGSTLSGATTGGASADSDVLVWSAGVSKV